MREEKQKKKESVHILLKNATVITMNESREIIANGGVAIKNDKIFEVGKSIDLEDRYTADKVFDCTGNIVLPGLIDAHGHGGHSLLKTIAADRPTVWESILTQVYFHYTEDDFWYHEGRLSSLERLKAGITTGLSVLGSQPRCDDKIFAKKHAQAYSEIGIREVVAVGPANPPWPKQFSRWVEGKKVSGNVAYDQVLRSLSDAVSELHNSNSGKIKVYVTPYLIVASMNSKGATPPDVAELTEFDKLQSRSVREIAAHYKTRIHSDAFGGMIKIALKDSNMLLGEDVSLQHCKGLSLEEVKILAETDTRVSHSSGGGNINRCPVPELLQEGVSVAIATDGSSPKTPFDLFYAMRKTQFENQLHFGDSFYMPPGKLLEMVTIDAARVLGMENELGSLENNKKADVIIVDCSEPHMRPLFMPVHRIVYQASGRDVDTVIVDGEVIMEKREVKRVNERIIIEKAQNVFPARRSFRI